MLPPVSVHQINGIPVYRSDIATPFTGTLTFGVGRRDETAKTAGIAHLLEHLIMLRVGKVTVAHNATTDDETVSFFAQGDAQLVTDFLNRVGSAVRTLGDCTESDVDAQRKIIAAELGNDDERAGRGALLDRFGVQSVGLIEFGSPGHRSLTRAEALSFAEEWFHAGNAAVALTGPIPDGLDITLPPARELPERPPAEVIRGGAWVMNGSTPVTISLVTSTDGDPAALPLADAVIADALFAALRTERGLVYSVNPFIAPLSRSSRFLAYALDPKQSDTLAAAAHGLDVIRRLAEDGPSDAQLSESLDQAQQYFADPSGQADALHGMVRAFLRGRTDLDDVSVPDVWSVSREQVKRVIADAIETLFVTFGDGSLDADVDAIVEALRLPFVTLSVPLYSTMGKAQLFKRLMAAGVETFNPRMLRGMKGYQIVIDHDRIACIFADGVMEISYDDVALAAYSEGQRFWAVLAMGGDLIVIDRDDWRGEKKMHALLESRLPQDRQIRIDRAD